MTRIRYLIAAACAILLLPTPDVAAHGGVFRGPNSGVPPGLREPSDAEPPPPPPTDPAPPGGPTTDPDNPHGPVTGHDPMGGPETGGTQPPDPRGGPNRTRPTRTRRITFESWRFWWAYNSDDILGLKRASLRRGVATSNPLHFSSAEDATNVRWGQAPTARAVRRLVIPALLGCIDRKNDHDDVHGGAIVALGKTGSIRHAALFHDVMRERYRNRRGERIDFGGQARESAVLALGLLPRLDANGKRIVREICLAAIADDRLRTRERTWAAVSLGLQRDREAVRPLLELLKRRYPDDNVPAGILAGLGLIGDDAARPPLEALFAGRRARTGDTSDRVRAFAGYALTKIGNPASLDLMLKVVRSRRMGRLVKRSAVIATGTLGARADQPSRTRAVDALLRYLRHSGGDRTGENWAVIALSRIGTPRALRALLDIAENGRHGQRAFAALGLGTCVHYRTRDGAQAAGSALDEELRLRIVTGLAALSHRFKDTETRAAFLLARGLVRDASAVEELVRIVSSRARAPELRGPCCVALGLLGHRDGSVRDALRSALRERTSANLRRDAATGLGLLQDAGAVQLLLDELKSTRSFAVQAQLITAIGTIGDQRAIAPLAGILDDVRRPVQTRALAAVGLGLIGELRPLPPLARLSRDYNYRASVNDLDELLYIL